MKKSERAIAKSVLTQLKLSQDPIKQIAANVIERYMEENRRLERERYIRPRNT